MKTFKTKKPSFFKKGTLVFSDSGHKLVRDGKYYRCSKNTNGECDLHKPISLEAFETKFSRLATKLYSERLDFDSIFKNLFRDHFWDIVFGIDERLLGKEEVADSTIELLKKDAGNGKKPSRSLVKDFEENYIESLKADYPVMLLGYAVGMVRVCSIEQKKSEMGRSLAHFSKKIYIGNDGEIEVIELERWAWYVFNAVIKKAYPEYLNEREDLKFMNEEDVLHTMSITKACEAFGETEFNDALGENFIACIGWIKFLKESFTGMFDDGQEGEMNSQFPELIEKMQNDPALGIMMRVSAITK